MGAIVTFIYNIEKYLWAFTCREPPEEAWEGQEIVRCFLEEPWSTCNLQKGGGFPKFGDVWCWWFRNPAVAPVEGPWFTSDNPPLGKTGMKSDHAPCEGEGKMSTNKALSSGRPAVDGRNRANQLRLVVSPIIYDGFHTSQVVRRISEPSTFNSMYTFIEGWLQVVIWSRLLHGAEEKKTLWFSISAVVCLI